MSTSMKDDHRVLRCCPQVFHETSEVGRLGERVPVSVLGKVGEASVLEQPVMICPGGVGVEDCRETKDSVQKLSADS